MRITLILLTLLVSVQLHSYSQVLTPDYPYYKALTKIHAQQARAAKSGDVKGMVQYYEDSSVCMPEYHPPIYTKNDITNYYGQWAKHTKTLEYAKRIIQLQQINDHLIEIGESSQTFQQTGKAPFTYECKYLSVWRIGKKGQLSLVSDAWGATKRIDPNVLGFVQKATPNYIPASTVRPSLRDSIAERNALISKRVRNREGELHAIETFAEDGMYLTYDTTILVGMDQIKPYFMDHEKPDGVSIDSIVISASRMIDLDEYVVEYGYYFVKVSWNGGGANVTGKSTNLWKRMPGGRYMMYRQMVNHD
ncbi:ketosteroid isomerase-like protein [Chitinophaga skermanii]|uniref:Ketosteroid isomerase-like protein n=1 Tax=Chitinophaga skermanii TaxID=331697 RepID=A0A327QVU3_9BACT|nr:DUF4440 domain-containing protein [Chitinophaga skermanii]RAJ08461.1 ketosteroid isomerase-like protein [Chitinophaga skermanii]